MYGIQPETDWGPNSTRQIGWSVSFRRNRKIYGKSFPYSRYESPEAALEAAKAWRDEMSRSIPCLTKLELSGRVRKNNTSGHAGVMLAVTKRSSANGVREHLAWIAVTPTGVKPRRTKSFSIPRYGDDRAYEMAVAAREAFIQELGKQSLAHFVPKKFLSEAEAVDKDSEETQWHFEVGPSTG
jgi:hypothetical protein